MKPRDELIEKIKKFYFEEFGEEISHRQAYERFMRLVNVLRVILRPMAGENQDGKKPGSLSHGVDE